jgi:hypothetical protein
MWSWATFPAGLNSTITRSSGGTLPSREFILKVRATCTRETAKYRQHLPRGTQMFIRSGRNCGSPALDTVLCGGTLCAEPVRREHWRERSGAIILPEIPTTCVQMPVAAISWEFDGRMAAKHRATEVSIGKETTGRAAARTERPQSWFDQLPQIRNLKIGL